MSKIAAIILALVLVVPQKVQPPIEFPEEILLQQEYSNSCTLSASAMMIRSCLHHNENNSYLDVTEEVLRAAAWTEAGLSWHWTYCNDDQLVTIAHQSVSGIDEQGLQSILENHPEGIVLYCGGAVHHAVFLFAYQDGTFYCADPAVGFSGKIIKLSDSLLGDRLGEQTQILQSVTAYWYVSDHETESQ